MMSVESCLCSSSQYRADLHVAAHVLLQMFRLTVVILNVFGLIMFNLAAHRYQ